MKILVTGGAGFIGSNLVDKLIELGHSVTVIDNESATENAEFYWNPLAENHVLDITDYAKTRPLYDNVNVVFHLASSARIQPSIKNPELTIFNNINGTETAIRCAREAGVKRFIFSSTSSIYGNGPLPNYETNPTDCLNIYSATKLFGENLCKIYNTTNFQTISLRYFNVYGPRQPIKGQYAPVIGLFLEQKKMGLPLTIVGDGTQERCFTHIDDVTRANILFATTDLPEEDYGQVYNIANPKPYSIKSIANLISDDTINIAPRPGEYAASLPAINRAYMTIGWKPSIDLDQWLLTRS